MVYVFDRYSGRYHIIGLNDVTNKIKYECNKVDEKSVYPLYGVSYL